MKYGMYILIPAMIFCLSGNRIAVEAQDQAASSTGYTPVFFPANGAVQVNPDTRLVITFPDNPILGITGKIRIFDASNDSLVDLLDMSIPPGPKNSRTPAPYDTFIYESEETYRKEFTGEDGKLFVPVPLEDIYQHNYLGGDLESDIYHFYPVLINGNTATICLHSSHLKYGRSYYVQIDPGVLSYGDSSLFSISGKSGWTFTTRAAPPSPDKDTFVVAADGTGDFNTVQGAIEFIPDKIPGRKTIFIKNGRYEEIVYFRNKENISIVGEDRENVVICYANNGFFNPRPTGQREEMISRFRNRRSIFAIHNSNDIHLENLTIISLGERPAQAEGLLVIGDRNIVNNVTIIGSGDALQATGTIYITHSSLTGFGDNVLGYGAVFFNECDLVSTYGPHLWVRNTNENHGDVFVNCTFSTIGDVETVIARAPDGPNYSFPYVEAVLINCSMEGIRPGGWGPVGNKTDDIRYWEFNSTNLNDGKPVDVSQRHPASRQLTMDHDSAIIAYYSNPENILKGWNPLKELLPVAGSGTYKPLDPKDPVTFEGDHILYRGEHIPLGPRAFFIDGQLTEEEAGKFPYVFNSVNRAASHLTDGTETDPMVLYIAPWVYWIDNPDDTAVRIPVSGGTPYGLVIDCEWLRFYGLTQDPENVVLACNRGQTIGARGNFTMFRFSGQGTSSENITFGNYCNVDLIYPLKTGLGREKRASAIVQAQLIHCNGDKIVARNTRFISRLNLCPFVGGKRVLFDRCHFESTDDALCATGVYLDCSFDFYSSKPFYWTRGTGSVMLNCDITSYTGGDQYFTKANGQLAVVDTRFHSKTMTYLGWRDIPPPEMRNYQYDVTINGNPVMISKRDPSATVEMDGKPVLDAYRFEYNGKVVYNTCNLLSGDDDWDPMNLKSTVTEAEKDNGKTYTGLPVQLLIAPTGITLETGKEETTLTATLNRFGNFETTGETIAWSIDPQSGSLVEMKVHEDGRGCDITPTNNTDDTRQVIIRATTPSGLEAASVISVAPSKLDPPEFITEPVLKMDRKGKIILDYRLDMTYKDQSPVTWYRCSDSGGSNPIEVAVSRFDQPLLEYELTPGDVGYYIMATIQPKHQRSDPGEDVSVITKDPVKFEEVRTDPETLETDFRNLSVKDQPEVIPGFWTFYSFEPDIAGRQRTANKSVDAWYYGEGSSGSAGYTGLLQSQYARMFYTPVGTSFGDMQLSMTVVPFKTAGQGFSVAPLYMDVLIKFDATTLTGFGLRFIRTTKYGNAVDCYFVKYEDGKVTQISDPVSTSCYRPVCHITLKVKGNKMMAHAVTDPKYKEVPDRPEVVEEVNMETEIDPNTFGSFGIEYVGGSTSLIKEMKVEWK